MLIKEYVDEMLSRIEKRLPLPVYNLMWQHVAGVVNRMLDDPELRQQRANMTGVDTTTDWSARAVELFSSGTTGETSAGVAALVSIALSLRAFEGVMVGPLRAAVDRLIEKLEAGVDDGEVKGDG